MLFVGFKLKYFCYKINRLVKPSYNQRVCQSISDLLKTILIKQSFKIYQKVAFNIAISMYQNLFFTHLQLMVYINKKYIYIFRY